MDITQLGISLHPEWLSTLFAYKSKTRAVFSDVLGLHEINHIAIAYIPRNQTLISLSSSPALEYNLFSSALWRYDNCYNPNWIKQCKQAHWQSLYSPERYDELYYIKQTKPRYPLGLAMAAELELGHIIYTVATTTDNEYTQTLFNTQQHELFQLGQYCSNQLLPILLDRQLFPSNFLQTSDIGTL